MSQEAVRRKLELKRGTPVPQDEAFKIAHVKKKANTNDPDQWCEERAERTYNQYQHSKAEFFRTQPPNTQLPEEQMEERWLESVGGPTRFGTAYGMPHRAFRQYRSPLEGLHSSNTESFDRVSAMAMEQKIAELSSQLQASEERERRRDTQFDGMRAQLDALLASRGIPSCADDARNPHTQCSGADDDGTHPSNTQRHA